MAESADDNLTIRQAKKNNAERSIRIKYKNLKEAVAKCNAGKGQNGSADEVIAYAPDLVHEIVIYYETILKDPNKKAPQRIQGLKYVDNMLKHNRTIPCCVIPKGGFHLPMGFPFVSFIQDVYWPKMDYETHHPDQLEAYKQYFEHQGVLPTFIAALEDIGYDVSVLKDEGVEQ